MPRTLVAKILSPRVEELFELVLREIRRAGYDGMLVAGGVLTGGTSLLPGMAEVAEQVLNLSVRLGKPIGVGGLREIVSNPSYSTAVGLIVHSVSRENEFELVGPGGGKGKKSPRGMGSMVYKMKGWIMNFF
jgi:cell division protein FtsA